MIRFARPLLAVCAVVALAACQKQPEPAKPAATPAPASTPAQPAATPAAPAPAPAAPVASADSVGVPECDTYLSKYEACLNGKVPEASRDAMKQGLEQTRAAWRSAAATDAGKAGLAQACVAAHEAAKASLNASGCTDF